MLGTLFPHPSRRALPLSRNSFKQVRFFVGIPCFFPGDALQSEPLFVSLATSTPPGPWFSCPAISTSFSSLGQSRFAQCFLGASDFVCLERIELAVRRCRRVDSTDFALTKGPALVDRWPTRLPFSCLRCLRALICTSTLFAGSAFRLQPFFASPSQICFPYLLHLS